MVLPHDLLWANLQKHLALSGRIQLLAPSSADIYMRCHLQSAELKREGVNSSYPMEPPSFWEGNRPYPIAKYPDYRRTYAYSRERRLFVRVRVEAWNRRSRELLFDRVYDEQELFPFFGGGVSRGNLESLFLDSEDQLEEAFNKLSERLASRVVRDFLSF